MDPDKLRRKICFQAAQLLHARRESSFTTAKWRAARSITRSYITTESLPTDMEIRMALQDLITSTPPTTAGVPTSSFDEPAESDSPPAGDSERQASMAQRHTAFHCLLEPLDRVRLNRREHPEGDLLYHSLQVFHLAYDGQPWDEELATAALLHDVGYGIDPHDPLPATVRAIADLVSERTLWLVENLEIQHRRADGTIGARARRRLEEHDDCETLRFLAECDRNGRVPGRRVDSLNDVLQTLLEMNDDDEL